MSISPLQDARHPIILAHRERLGKAKGDPLKTFKELLAVKKDMPMMKEMMKGKKATKKKSKSSKAGLKQKMGTMPKKKGIKTKGQKGYI